MASQDPEFFILKEWARMPAEYEDSLLGAVVMNYADPAQESTVPELGEESHLTKFKHKTFGGQFSDFVVNNYQKETKEASAVLKSLAGVKFTGETSDTVHLNGKFIRYKRVRDIPAFFKKLREDEDVKSRVPNWIQLSDVLKRDVRVCLVVGVMICEDVDVEWGTDERKDVSGNIEIPIDKIVLAAGAPNPIGHTGNPQVAASNGQTVGRLFKAHSSESRIFAVELKRLTKGYILKQGELIMKSKGPSVDRGRVLGGDRDRNDSAIDDDELFLEDFELE
jgi:hypothetical protein